MTAIPGSAARGFCVAEAFTFPSPRTTLKPEERALPPTRLQLRRPDSRLGTVGWPRSGPRFLAAPSIPAFYAIGARGFTAALTNVWPARSDAISALPGAGRWEEARALIAGMQVFEDIRAEEQGGANVAGVKEALLLMGHDFGAARGHPRPGRLPTRSARDSGPSWRRTACFQVLRVPFPDQQAFLRMRTSPE